MFHKEKRRGSGFLDKVNKLEGGGVDLGPHYCPITAGQSVTGY